MKKIIILLGIVFLSQSATQAQETKKFKALFTIGALAIPDAGLHIGIEPQYTISERNTLGLQLKGMAAAGRDVTFTNESEFGVDKRGVSGYSIMATYERALGKTDSKFQPYVGGGLGIFRSSNNVGAFRIDSTSDLVIPVDISVNTQPTAMLRGGVALGRFRLELFYTFVANADVILFDGSTIGSVNDNHLGFALGFTFGGGKKN